MNPNYDTFKNDILRGWPMNSHCSKETLERKEYEARIEIDRRALETCRRRGTHNEFLDQARDQLVWTLRMCVYGKDHPSKHVIRFPENWWEAVKERFAPSWFRDRYPVRFTEVTASVEELYPELEPALPDNHPVLKTRVQKRFETPIW